MSQAGNIDASTAIAPEKAGPFIAHPPFASDIGKTGAITYI